MLHTKSQGHWPFVPENKIFKGFFTYMGAVALTLKLVSLDLTYQVRIMTLPQQYSKNQLFKKFHIEMQSESNSTMMLSRSRST